MLGFKPRISGARSDRSGNCATATASSVVMFVIPRFSRFVRDACKRLEAGSRRSSAPEGLPGKPPDHEHRPEGLRRRRRRPVCPEAEERAH